MLRQLLSAAFVITMWTGVQAATSNPYVVENPQEGYTRLVLAGCRLGQENDLPSKLAMSFTGTASVYKLDATVKLYVEWLFDTDDGPPYSPVRFDPPVAIDDEAFSAWFGDGSGFLVKAVSQTVAGRYKACPQSEKIEAPTELSYPLNSAGELTIQDRFGGVGDQTIIWMEHLIDNSPAYAEIFVGWTYPNSWFDDAIDDTDDFNAGEIYNRKTVFDGAFYTHTPMHVVEWVSSDIANIGGSSEGPSPRAVDASDAGAWSTFSSGAVRWGFETESPASSPTWHGDILPIGSSHGQIDASDTAWLAYTLSTSCSEGKPTADSNAEAIAIMEWLGYARTRNMINLGEGLIVPEWEFVDPIQRAIGQADPYGYRQHFNAAARGVTWSGAKQLYR